MTILNIYSQDGNAKKQNDTLHCLRHDTNPVLFPFVELPFSVSLLLAEERSYLSHDSSVETIQTETSEVNVIIKKKIFEIYII